MKLSRKHVDDAIVIADIYPEDINVRTDYSGRGMYGATCFGIDFDRESDAYKFVAALAIVLSRASEDGEQEALDVAAAATTDSMGRGMILYFPGVTLEN